MIRRIYRDLVAGSGERLPRSNHHDLEVAEVDGVERAVRDDHNLHFGERSRR